MNGRKSEPPKMDTTRRYNVGSQGEITPGVFDTTGPLMPALMSADSHDVKFLSSVGKIDDKNRVVLKTDYRLPPVQVTAAIINKTRGIIPHGTGSMDNFPYKLKAVGFVNPMRIFRRKNGEFVSDRVELAP